MISSLANPRVKRVRRLQADRRYRGREKAFVVEGTRLLQELITSLNRLQAVFYTRDWLADGEHESLLANINTDFVSFEVSSEVLTAISATETPSGVIAVAEIKPQPLPTQPAQLLILDAIANPGNLGAMLRTAAASGADAVLLGPDCVDAHNPKVVRGAMGAHFRLPVAHLNWSQIENYADPLTVWLSDAHGNTLYTEVDWRGPSALIVGNEARGVGREARALAHGSVKIPMAHETESLNAAMATAVILFEAFRQRGFQKA